MVATNFTTENRTYRQLLGNGLTYRVPRFQRDYSWGEEEWEDLWHDISDIVRGVEPAHYMGYLVLKTSDNRNFDIIDGQQRLTTLSLIVLAAMKLIKELIAQDYHAADNQKRLDQLRASYIGYLDPVTLTTRNKLTLNRNNDDYYRNYLATLADHLPQRGFPASTLTMRKSFLWFERRLRDHIANAADRGKALASFVETISDKLFFTVITVADELNAYRVFETLNARGVRLSATDLLKNYLFAVLAREASSNLDDLERHWDSIVDRLGSESVPEFLRTHWNSRHPLARQSELFKVIRTHITSRADVFTLLREMDEDLDAYLALTQPSGAAWPPQWKAYAQELAMFSVRLPFAMLMAAKRRLSDDDFGALLRATVVITFRYNVIGSLHTGELERVYNAIALRLHRGELTTWSQVSDALRPIYPSDEAFRTYFAEAALKTSQSRNAKIVRYILCQLEKQVSGQDFDYESANYTIEHILPQSPAQGWEAFDDRDLEQFVHRIGNMAMLEAGKNRDLGNRSYAEKRPILQQSVFALTRQLAEENDDWTPERLTAWQRKLARIAAGVWRIDRLSEQ